MEHVLRQCIIALRLGERMGLDEQERSVLYYTALLVNVGRHTDAHEQAKWFGDDIAIKALKFDEDMVGFRAAAGMLRHLGAGRAPLHRFRTGLEFAFGGHREVDDMIAQHARLAAAFGRHLGLPDAVLDRSAGSYESWDGRGWPAGLSGDAIPLASRITQLAELVEVAHRTGGEAAALALAAPAQGPSSIPPSCAACARSGEVFGDLDTPGRGRRSSTPSRRWTWC